MTSFFVIYVLLFFFLFFLCFFIFVFICFFFFKQKTAYEIYQCDWSSDVCSSDLVDLPEPLGESSNDNGNYNGLSVPLKELMSLSGINPDKQ